MQIIVLATAGQREDFTGEASSPNFVWITNANEFLHYKTADAFIDLMFVNTAERKGLLQQLLPKPVIINSVIDTLEETNPSFIRINGWPTFLSSPLIEAVCSNNDVKVKAEEIFSFVRKQIEWLPDEAGFVTARVISMIINEAYCALSEGVSTKNEINTAMKLGTAYPYGPFEWAEKIGVENVVALLKKLSKTERRYEPAGLLMNEMRKVI